ncbi:MAG: addiction module toxin, HicA family [Chloroflexi bacterium]|nr:addiction module toxin, HicA family [Chloroflexota bacterium]MYC00909.1 addiction module toxin, HicA family [Chloroflexota bacterium]
MARLRNLSGRQVATILRRHGFIDVRQKGSHLQMRGVVEGRRVIVTVPQHRRVKIGTLLAIVKRSGIPRSEFE